MNLANQRVLALTSVLDTKATVLRVSLGAGHTVGPGLVYSSFTPIPVPAHVVETSECCRFGD